MYATLAQIKLAYLAVIGAELPADKPFVDAGNEVISKLGQKKAQRVFNKCGEVIAANPYPATYESMVPAVKEVL